MGTDAENTEQQPIGRPPDGPVVEPAIWVIVGGVLAAVVGGLMAWFLGRSLREIEALTALVLLCTGLLFDLRSGIHLRLGYLWFSKGFEDGWPKSRRWRLGLLTVVDVAASLVMTGAGLHYLLHPGRGWQLGVTFLMMVLMSGLVESTRRLVASGGPKCGADVIENCGPVEWLLHDDRIWTGDWGIDAAARAISRKVPVGSRSKAAALLVLGILFSLLTQMGVVAGRTVKGSDSVPGQDPPARMPPSDRSSSGQGSSGETGQAGAADNPCGGEITPGDGAPEPVRAEIRRAWEEKAPASGCALRARPNPSRSAYLVEGECQGRPWSLGIGAWNRGAAILLEDAAAAARRIGDHRELVGASERVDLAGGDFQLVLTPVGPYLLIREQKTDGNGGLVEPPETCADIEPGTEHYVALPPGMAELFLRFNREVANAWPLALAEGSRYEFTAAGLSHETLATGLCSTPVKCKVTGPGVQMESTAAGVRQVTVRAVLEAGPT